MKNGISYEFYSADEKIIDNWFNCLRQFCILTTFHDEYKAIKMIGKGSFAKVIYILNILLQIIFLIKQVYLVDKKQTGRNYAVKAFTKESVIVSNKANAKVFLFY